MVPIKAWHVTNLLGNFQTLPYACDITNNAVGPHPGMMPRRTSGNANIAAGPVAEQYMLSYEKVYFLPWGHLDTRGVSTAAMMLI